MVHTTHTHARTHTHTHTLVRTHAQAHTHAHTLQHISYHTPRYYVHGADTCTYAQPTLLLQVNLLKQSSSEDSGGSELEEELSVLREIFESDLDSAEEPVCELDMGLGMDRSELLNQ